MSLNPMLIPDTRLDEKAKEFAGNMVETAIQSSGLVYKMKNLVAYAYRSGFIDGEDSLMKKAQEIAATKEIK